MDAEINPLTGTVLIVGVIVLIGGIATLGMAFESVDEGEVKVVKDKGEVTGEVFEPGWHTKTPISEDTVSVPTRPQTYTMSGDPWEGNSDEVDSIGLMSSDQQQVNVDVTVRYRVPADQAPQFHGEWNTISQAENRVIRPETEGVVQQRASSMNATQANSDEGRELLAEEIKNQLEDATGQEIVIDGVQVRDIHLDPNYAEELENVEIEETRAEQRLIESRGIAEAEVEEAQGQAEAYEIRNEELTDAVLMEAYIEGLDETDTVIMATDDSGSPIILDADSADVETDGSWGD